jgi:hypothetical protein
MNDRITTANVVTSTALAAAVVSVSQVMIEIAAPDSLWSVVQTKTQFWAGAQMIINWALMHFGRRYFQEGQ